MSDQKSLQVISDTGAILGDAIALVKSGVIEDLIGLFNDGFSLGSFIQVFKLFKQAKGPLLQLLSDAKKVYADGQAALPELKAGLSMSEDLELGEASLSMLIKVYEDQK